MNQHSQAGDFVVTDGVDFVRSSSSPGHLQRIRCVISLPNTQRASRTWHVQEAWRRYRKSGRSTDGKLLAECIWRDNKKIVMTPSMVFTDGEPAAVEIGDGVSNRRVEFTAATSMTTSPKPPLSGTTGTGSAGRSGVCLVTTTSCWALVKNVPPRLCPDGALSCWARAGRVIPLHERMPLPDR